MPSSWFPLSLRPLAQQHHLHWPDSNHLDPDPSEQGSRTLTTASPSPALVKSCGTSFASRLLPPHPTSALFCPDFCCPFDKERFHSARQEDSIFCKACVTTNKTPSTKQHPKPSGRAEFARSQGSWQDCCSQRAKENSFCLWC